MVNGSSRDTQDFLDIQAMDLEHVRGFNNSDDGEPGEKEFHERENDDNFTLINSNVNQLKSNDSIEIL